MMNRARPRARSRRALTTVVVLVCLIVITLIGAALLKVGLAQRKAVRSEEHRLQAEWLAESGLDRALARVTLDRNYRGEEWPIRPEDLSLGALASVGEPSSSAAQPAAVITISVERIAESANRRRIRVQADFPLDPLVRSRHTKQMVIDLEPDKAGAAQ